MILLLGGKNMKKIKLSDLIIVWTSWIISQVIVSGLVYKSWGAAIFISATVILSTGTLYFICGKKIND